MGGNEPTLTPIQTLMGSIEDVFGQAIDMVGTVATTIVGEPVLLLFTVLPLCGIAIGMFKRLLRVN